MSISDRKKETKKKTRKKKTENPADTLRIEIRLVWLFNLIGGWRFALPFFLFFHCHSQAFVWASSSWVTESKVVREPLIFLFLQENYHAANTLKLIEEKLKGNNFFFFFFAEWITSCHELSRVDILRTFLTLRKTDPKIIMIIIIILISICQSQTRSESLSD